MLLIDDLSYFDYTNKGVADELGMTGNRNSYGLVTSPLLAVTPDRHCMGLADWKTWCRDPKLEPSSKRWFKQKIEEKETFHWLKRYRQTCGWQKELPNTQLIYIADRGSDIIDIYTEAENRKNAGEPFAWYVIRCAYDRLIPDLPCTVVFSDSEWKATYRIMNKKKPLPSEPISLKTMILYVGNLGGFMPRKGCEFPGIKSIWKGMQKVYDYANAYDVFVLGK